MSHTPGSWKVIDPGAYVMVYGPNGERICKMIDEPKKENAQLIAKAPTMSQEIDRLREGLCEIANQGLEPWAARKALEILDGKEE